MPYALNGLKSISITLVFLLLTDIQLINSQSVKAINSGMVIVGGGLVKHHISNANLMVRRTLF